MRSARGFAAIAAAAVLFAVGGTYARTLTDAGLDVLALVQSRSWISLAGLAAVLALRRRPGLRGVVGVWRPALLFGAGLAGANFFYYLALSRIPVAIAIVVQYTAPALVVIWTAAACRERPSWGVAAAVVLALAGVTLLAEVHAVTASGLDGIGVAAAAASAVSFAVYVLSGERVTSRLGTEAAMVVAFSVTSALWAAVAAVRGVPTLLERRFAFGVLFLGTVGTLLPFLGFVWGLRRVRASRTGIVASLEPVTAALLAWVWLGQSLSGVQLAGGALVLVGIGVLQTEARPVARVPAAD